MTHFADYDDCLPNEALRDQWQNTKTSWVTAQAEAKHPELKSFAFLETGVIKGERNETAFSYARILRSCGKIKEEAIDLLSTWNKKNYPPLDRAELLTTIDSAYSFKGKSVDPQNTLQALQYDLLYRKMPAAQRDVLVNILIRLQREPSNHIDNSGNQYHLEPGEMLFSFRGFAEDCARDVGKSTVGTVIRLLEKHGWIELLPLGGRRLSILRFRYFSTQDHMQNNTPDE